MRYDKQVEIDTSADAVWTVLADVAAWPTWTPTFERVEPDDPALAPGSGITIKQPRRKQMRYAVQTREPGRQFRWGSRRRGVDQWADHVIVDDAPRRCTVTLTFAMNGLVGTVLGALGAGTIRRMVDTEAASLKEKVEAGPAVA